MYEVKAYVKQVKMEAVIDALAQLDCVTGIAVVRLHEYGHALETGKLTRVDMVKLEVDVASLEDAEHAARRIVDEARTGPGHPGDGRVMITELHRATRIDDGADGPAAFAPRRT
ncbi:MAG: transcriptional regulator [Gammaproteobacteria bacterium]|nr:transcriptional regulator [Gammaproteobacteria bacterium]|tara:strand:+ start:9746 stop:10087 length:342 start_codon:yes stop_codon:yes gene_type:complete